MTYIQLLSEVCWKKTKERNPLQHIPQLFIQTLKTVSRSSECYSRDCYGSWHQQKALQATKDQGLSPSHAGITTSSHVAVPSQTWTEWLLPAQMMKACRQMLCQMYSGPSLQWAARDPPFPSLTLACCRMAWAWASCAETIGPLEPASPPPLKRNWWEQGREQVTGCCHSMQALLLHSSVQHD